VPDDREQQAATNSNNGRQTEKQKKEAIERQVRIQKEKERLLEDLISAISYSNSKKFELCMKKYEASEAKPNINNPVCYWSAYGPLSGSWPSLLHVVITAGLTDKVKRKMIASMLSHAKPNVNLQDYRYPESLTPEEYKHPEYLTPADYVARKGDIGSYVLLKMNGGQIHESTIRFVIKKAAENKRCRFNKDLRWEKLLPLLSDAPLIIEKRYKPWPPVNANRNIS
jgi:hypothetical protein